MSEDEYILFEHQSEIRHEYVNGKLIALPGESDINNLVSLNIAILLRTLLRNTSYFVFVKDVKVKVAGETKYFYPDVFVTKEPLSAQIEFVKHKPELIVEVLSEGTRKYDTVDKFINYQKFESLQYYMLVEPEFPLISLFSRIPESDWELSMFAKPEDIIQLSALNIFFKVEDVYKT